MTHTTNLNLNKPDLNDNVNVATDINDNMELIDAAYGNMRDDFGDVYDPTATYAKDDICIYNNVLYQANTAISTPEAWNASHWDAKSVAELVGALNSNVSKLPLLDKTGALTASGGSVTVSNGNADAIFIVAIGGWNYSQLFTVMAANGGTPKKTLLASLNQESGGEYFPVTASGSWDFTITNNTTYTQAYSIYKIKKNL